jgi:hypothetical protein
MPVPVAVRNTDGDGFELVAGFHTTAPRPSLGANVVPVVVRDAATPGRRPAVENLTSCRHRHGAIDADRVGMPTCVASYPPSAAFLLARSP